MKMFIVLYLSMINSVEAHNSDYDHGMSLDAERVVRMENGKMIKLSVFHQSGSNLSKYDPSFMMDNFEIYSNIYHKEYGLPKEDLSCRSDNLKVYYVKSSYLNDYDTLSYYNLPRIDLEKKKYLAFYSYKNYDNVIMITDSDWNKLSLEKRYIHEIAHLWYAKKCKYVVSPENERQALDIEDKVK